MIITEYVNVKIINHNINHYKNLGYNVKCGNIIEIPTAHLSKGSHIKIQVMCEECKSIKLVKYQDYYNSITNYKYYSCNKCKGKQKKFYKENYGVENVSQLQETKDKKIQKSLEKYGVINVFQSEKIKEKSKITCIEKYGTEYASQSEIILEKSKNTRIDRKLQTSPEKLTELDKYYILSRKITRKNKKILLSNWDGLDYYDNEFIKDNFSLKTNDSNYPTIDHKISVFYGFNNNIPVMEICSIQNLCITKRKHNSSKRIKNDLEYQEYIKNI